MTGEVPLSATGLLAEFAGYGVLGWADVHPARHLCHLFGERDEQVALAAALAVRALRAGSLCVDVAGAPGAVAQWEPIGDAETAAVDVPLASWPDAQGWLAALHDSPAVAAGDAPGDPRPLRLVGTDLYLERYWADQEAVREGIWRQLETRPAPLGAGSSTPSADPHAYAQEAAVASALDRGLTVIAGGPGTGKTHVIARIVQAFTTGPTPALVGLAAPTGKAAARMTDSLRAEAERTGGELTTAKASTVHRLLGWKPGSRTRFRHDRSNPLPHDVVIVDELSMVSMTLMARLLGALKPGARLVVVGDPDQLASVEAGAVLADLTSSSRLQPAVVRLDHNFRFSGAIAQLAGAIRAGDAAAALDVLASGEASVRLVAPEAGEAALRERCVAAGRGVFAAASAGDGREALRFLDAHRLLCAHRRGPFGVQQWSRTVASWLVDDVPGYSTDAEFYVGRPLLMTRNAAELELFNGDTGVVVARGDAPQAVFASGSGPRAFSPYLLDGLASVHAMTIHKSQGSQFADVSVVLPPVGSPLLTRELLYTAVTRASSGVLLVGTPDAVRAAVARPTARTSGLRERLG